jgi:hypothetical protein
MRLASPGGERMTVIVTQHDKLIEVQSGRIVASFDTAGFRDIGHGQPRRLDYVQVPGGAFPILDADDSSRMRALEGSPIALMLACYTGAFDQPRDCLAESMLRTQGGPVAAICGSRVTMPYGMAVMCDALMDEFFRQRRETLGELLLHAKRRMVQAEPDGGRRRMLDAIASSLSPPGHDLDEERREHVQLFNLLGDPLLRLPQPAAISVQTDSAVTAGEVLQVTMDCPLPGEGTLEFVCRRDRSRTPLPTRLRFEPTHRFLASFNDTYRRINDPVWWSRPVRLPAGSSTLELPVPADARGPCHVRILLSGSDAFALGARDVFVRAPRESE